MTSVILDIVGQSLTSKRESPGSDPFILPGFMQLLQEAAVSVLLRSTVSEGPAREL